MTIPTASDSPSTSTSTSPSSPPPAGGEPPLVAELVGVTKSFGSRTSSSRAVDDVSITLRRGDRLALIGESGSGKSTLARMLLGLIPNDSGSIRILGQDWQELRPAARRTLRGRIGVVFQEPVGALNPRLSVESIIAEPLRTHRRELSKSDVTAKVSAALERVHLPVAFLSRLPAQLSGGQAQRVALARALVNEPELLVLDEPTSALDVSVQAEILRLLAEIAEQSELSWLFITHDLGVAADACDRAAVMCRGRLVEEGASQVILSTPQDAYTQRLLTASLHNGALLETAQRRRANLARETASAGPV